MTLPTRTTAADLRRRWARQQPVQGVWSLLPGAVTAELLAGTGAGYVVLDLQHGALAESDLPAVTAAALDDLGAVLAVEGLDGIYVGPSDLSLSLGRAGDEHRDHMRTVIASIVTRAVAAGMPVGVHTSRARWPPATPRRAPPSSPPPSTSRSWPTACATSWPSPGRATTADDDRHRPARGPGRL